MWEKERNFESERKRESEIKKESQGFEFFVLVLVFMGFYFYLSFLSLFFSFS